MAPRNGNGNGNGNNGGNRPAIQCNHCNKFGHKAADCFSNPSSQNYKGPRGNGPNNNNSANDSQYQNQNQNQNRNHQYGNNNKQHYNNAQSHRNSNQQHFNNSQNRGNQSYPAGISPDDELASIYEQEGAAMTMLLVAAQILEQERGHDGMIRAMESIVYMHADAARSQEWDGQVDRAGDVVMMGNEYDDWEL